VTGAAFEVRLDGAPVEPWRAVPVGANQVLAIGSGRTGARAYLAVRGGIAVPRVLGSASTHLQSELGGFGGRALRIGDSLDFGGDGDSAALPETGDGPSTNTTRDGWEPRRVSPAALARLAPRRTLRVVRGADAPEFGADAWTTLLDSAFRVSDRSNRMGLRLEGPALSLTAPREFLTEGAPLGALQVPPDGRPIVLFVEHQTTGGYPKIANVIAADIPSLGQLRPRDEVRFSLVTLEAAWAALLEQEELVRSPAIFEP
jgi:antagonist of KipI